MWCTTYIVPRVGILIMEFKVTLSLGPVAGFLDEKTPISNDFEKGFPSQVIIKTRKSIIICINIYKHVYMHMYISQRSYFENKNQLYLIALRFLDEQLLLTEFVSCQERNQHLCRKLTQI